MKTTIELPAQLLADAETLAAERRVPLTLLLEESLRSYLHHERRREPGELEPLPVLTTPLPVPGVDLDDTSRLWAL
jgi:hypothetical protein